MAYTLKAFKYKEEKESDIVYLLCKDGIDPFEQCKNIDCKVASALKRATKSVSERGIEWSKQARTIKKLHGPKGIDDLYEITVSKFAVRGFSFMIDNEQKLVLAFIQKVHSGNGKTETNNAIKKLNGMRDKLEEALEGKDER